MIVNRKILKTNFYFNLGEDQEEEEGEEEETEEQDESKRDIFEDKSPQECLQILSRMQRISPLYR